MPVTRVARAHAGVAGVAFSTSEQPGTPKEAELQEIQSTLSLGKTSIGSDEPIAHLFLEASMAVDLATGQGVPGPDTIGLWVPAELEGQAVGLLTAAGFMLA